MGSPVQRTPVQVQRRPITMLSKAGHKKSGGWYVFARPEEDPPAWKLDKGERVLWCPWCAEWSVYKKTFGEDVWRCQGYCGWANTGEYYVRQTNKIWFEDVPLSEMKKLEIPRPNGRR